MPGTQNDLHQQLQDEVLQAKATGSCLAIQGGGSKQFYGRKVAADKVLNTAAHQGIISYEPAELFIQARAGTTLTEIHKTLTEEGQMLAFEPPVYNEKSTLGGTLAGNFSGPRRAYSGAARDYVLGTTLLNGKAEIASFGGQVMKNVAGYDVSRLMVGALGTLGVIMDASIKVVPIPEAEITLMQETSIETALSKLHEWSRLPLGISASCFYKNKLYLRLSGTEKAIYAAVKKIGGEPLNQADEFWQSISNQSHVFFQNEQSLWRLSLASNTPPLFTNEDTLYEWGGALRWLKSDVAQQTIRADSHLINGHSTLFRSSSPHDAVFQPLAPPLLKLHQRLKQAFDPQGIFNIGRMYPDF
ncbi:glycolate oxidase subunit GlcE [Methyloprofundus sp.]|uniref:glycolate oxidase subunit GlcE n=1 Tax=Methyloprofundus sp. TaxID=2020875 RepID=UPI003D0C7071